MTSRVWLISGAREHHPSSLTLVRQSPWATTYPRFAAKTHGLAQMEQRSAGAVQEIPANAFEVDIQLVGPSRGRRPAPTALAYEALRPGEVVALEVTPALFFAERREAQFALSKRLRGDTHQVGETIK